MTDLVVAEVNDDGLDATWPVMSQLRPHLDLASYRAMVARMRISDGIRVIAASRDGRVVGVMGVRPMELLYAGRILQVDDLVVDSSERSGGVGQALLNWVKADALVQGRAEVHLDSALVRQDAHRFYDREGFERLGYHFRIKLQT
jgi:GNAT superfamily N-acetyltransferase